MSKKKSSIAQIRLPGFQVIRSNHPDLINQLHLLVFLDSYL
jgi:hypothetical protein